MYTYIEHVPICVGVFMHVSVYVYVHVYPQRVGRGSWVAVDIYLVEPRSGYKAIVLRLSVYVCVLFVRERRHRHMICDFDCSNVSKIKPKS